MKIVEGLHKIKALRAKIGDLQLKIAAYCADMDIENPTYGTPDKQTAQIKEWLQSVHDSTKEIMRIKLLIQKTNINTRVKIDIGNTSVTHSIAEWIMRRVELANLEMNSWKVLTNKNLKPQNYAPDPANRELIQVTNPRLYYDPKEKDKKVSEYSEEPNLINAKLEVVNAVTDLIE